MKTIKELAQSLRDIIPKQWDNGDVVWTAGVLTGMEHAADRIDAWAAENMPEYGEDILLSVGAGFKYIGRYWRPLGPNDSPPEQSK